MKNVNTSRGESVLEYIKQKETRKGKHEKMNGMTTKSSHMDKNIEGQECLHNEDITLGRNKVGRQSI